MKRLAELGPEDFVAHPVWECLRHRRVPETVTPSDVRWFFEIRQLVDFGRLECISVDTDAPRFRELRPKLSTPEYERLYAEWLRHGAAALAEYETSSKAASDGFLPGQGLLLVRELKHDYRHFDHVVGVSR